MSGVYLDDDLLARIDEVRDFRSRSEWVEEAVRRMFIIREANRVYDDFPPDGEDHAFTPCPPESGLTTCAICELTRGAHDR